MKEELHRLVDALPASELSAARRLLEYLRDRGTDPLLRTLLEAQEDDEPETVEEKAAVKEAYAGIGAGRVVPHKEARKRLLGKP
ncbi:MAG: hypothetical protein ACRD2L_17710 [Terriglobia bacterium]